MFGFLTDVLVILILHHCVNEFIKRLLDCNNTIRTTNDSVVDQQSTKDVDDMTSRISIEAARVAVSDAVILS